MTDPLSADLTTSGSFHWSCKWTWTICLCETFGNVIYEV